MKKLLILIIILIINIAANSQDTLTSSELKYAAEYILHLEKKCNIQLKLITELEIQSNNYKVLMTEESKYHELVNRQFSVIENSLKNINNANSNFKINKYSPWIIVGISIIGTVFVIRSGGS